MQEINLNCFLSRSVNYYVSFQKRNACRVLVWKPERRRELGRPRCRWVIILK
jgi:hypothetical protein